MADSNAGSAAREVAIASASEVLPAMASSMSVSTVGDKEWWIGQRGCVRLWRELERMEGLQDTVDRG